jgi:hypothetical protein
MRTLPTWWMWVGIQHRIMVKSLEIKRSKTIFDPIERSFSMNAIIFYRFLFEELLKEETIISERN